MRHLCDGTDCHGIDSYTPYEGLTSDEPEVRGICPEAGGSHSQFYCYFDKYWIK